MSKHIAILQTGENNAALSAAQPQPPGLFRALLDEAVTAGKITLSTFAVLRSEFPSAATDFDGYIITGSASGVYEDDAWIDRLMSFIQDVYAANIPIVGICFGHQALAQALGGEVIKSPKGWGLGIRTVGMTETGQQLAEARDDLKLIYVHQDQVIELPEQAERLAGDAFCPNAAFRIGDKVLAFQGHPEFTESYVSELFDVLIPRVGADKAAQAHQSMSDTDDGHLVGKWMVSFLTNS